MPDLIVVEDDPEIGEQLAAALTAQGHRVFWARTGRAALDRIAAAGRADLVLLDIGLPDIDGTALARQLRSALPDTVLVMLTAHTDEIDVVMGLDAGADDYLTKPFRLTELLARVQGRDQLGHHVLELAVVGVVEIAVHDRAQRPLRGAGRSRQIG